MSRRNPYPRRRVTPFMIENVRPIFEKTIDLRTLCIELGISPDKWGDAASAAEWYVTHNTWKKTWRYMIYCLDGSGDTALADTILDRAEPPADPTFTPDRVSNVFEVIEGDLSSGLVPLAPEKDLSEHLLVPHLVPRPRVQLLQQKFGPLHLKREAGYHYCSYYPTSWKELSWNLYKHGESKALQLAKPHLQTVRDGSLTADNVYSTTINIPLWDSVDSLVYLDMPRELHEEIVQRSMHDEEASKKRLLTSWVDHHPCPTWEHVVRLLRQLEREGRVGAAEEVEEKYLKMSPEKAQQILQDSLKDGSIPQSALKVLAAGAARSGKTLSKNHIFSIKFHGELSPSTGVCEAPIPAIRSFSCEMVDASLPEWQPLTQDKLLRALALKLGRGLIRGDLAEVASKIIQDSSTSSLPPVLETTALPPPPPSGTSQAEQAMVHTLHKDYKPQHRLHPILKALPDSEQEIYMLQLILFIDSGGQPQFHEVLPALSHNICLILLFLKLNERLDHPCSTAFTDEDGEWFNEECPSLLTNEQMIVQLVHTMMSKPLPQVEGKRPLFMVIGTHLDQIDECNGETLADKNAALANLFSDLDDELVRNGDDIIFPVNALNPDEKSREVFGKIRRIIAEMGVALEQNTPLSWFMFQNDMIKHWEESGKGVVSMEECLAIAGRLKMDRQSLQAALIHFNNLSIFLYTSVLPNHVFIDPQMPLNLVNKCAAFSYKVQSGKGPPLTRRQSRPWKEGIITREMLEDDEFSSCFIHGVFDAGHALKLLASLHIVAPLSKGEFIMPSMLQAASATQIKELLPPHDEHVAPLLVHFPNGRIPNGTFCATHNCLRSKYDWTTCCNSKREVQCLYRNIVKLQHPDEPVMITFVHAPSLKHFEVHIETEEKNLLPELCPRIRRNVLDSIRNVEDTFRYKESGADVAFLCPCDQNYCHAASLNKNQSSLKCTESSKVFSRRYVTAAHTVWLTAAVKMHAVPQESTVEQTTTPSEDEQPTMMELLHLKTSRNECVNVIREIGTNYSTLGTHLLQDRTGARVASISHHRSPEEATREILRQWLEGSGQLPVTWTTLVEALEKSELCSLAKDIRTVKMPDTYHERLLSSPQAKR